MKKKFLLIIFAIFISITCLGKVDAAKELVCNYALAPSGGQSRVYEVTIYLNGDVSNIQKVTYSKTKRGETPNVSDVTDQYKDVVLNLTETSDCPPSEVIFGYGIGGTGQSETNAGYSSCINYRSRETCNKSISTGKVGCVWKNLGKDSDDNDFGFCSTTGLTYVACGDSIDIPSEVPRIASLAVTLLKIGTAIVLILMGTITLLKAVYSSKEEEIKKAQSSFIKKLIAAALVFFIVSIVQFIILKVADTGTNGEDAGIKECLSCFLNDDCDSVTYYKNVDFADNETCYKVPTTANATPTEITCPALPNN